LSSSLDSENDAADQLLAAAANSMCGTQENVSANKRTKAKASAPKSKGKVVVKPIEIKCE